MKLKLFTILAALLVVSGILAACGDADPTDTTESVQTTTPTDSPTPSTEPTTEPVTVSEEESRQIALEFLMNEPTYLFDGMEDTIVLTETLTLSSTSCWNFAYEFDSRHAGYGDRTDQIVAQVITHHQAVITVEQGNVTQAVMDETWDMQVRMMIATVEESVAAAREYLLNSPTFQYDGIEDTVILVETLETLGFYTWGFVFEFDCASAGYGDRTGQETAQVVTHHVATITVSEGSVESGTIDDTWNMETQQEIGEPQIATATATAP